MTNEEAINVLKMCENNCGDCLTCKEHDEAIALAIEALEKQIAKKLYAKRNEAICPNCGQTLTEFFEFPIKTPYCDRCGQAIDWSDDE